MKTWSLKVQFGAYSALLATMAVVAAALVAIPTIYYRQLAGFDAQTAVSADEFFRDLLNFQGAPINPRRPLKERFVPFVLRDRYVRLEGPEGQLLYGSPRTGDADLKALLGGRRRATVTLHRSRCRLTVFRRSDYTLWVGVPLDTLEDLRGDLLTGTLAALPGMALVVFLGGLWLGKKAVAPVTRVTEVAERISADQPDERLPTPATRDEIARLTEVLNGAFDRLRAAYEATARFSADASHQLKTPITVLRAGLEGLRDGGALSSENRAEVSALLSQTRRLTTLVEDLLLLAQAEADALPLEAGTLDVAPLVRSAADDLDALGHDRGLSVALDCPEFLRVRADARRVSVVLQNLVENAARYALENSSVAVRAAPRDGFAEVTVESRSCPISPEEQERIFQRFHRGSTGENVRGHGLGLNIAAALAKAQGGDLRLARSDEDGTAFVLRLPLA